MEIYHTPTDSCITCLCLNTDKFSLDCEKYIIGRYRTFSVNPKERFYARIDKLLDDIIREVKKVPITFRMRLESRHCIKSKNISFAFQMYDKDLSKCNDVIKRLTEEEKQTYFNMPFDFVIVYTGVKS